MVSAVCQGSLQPCASRETWKKQIRHRDRKKSKSESHSVVSDSYNPMNSSPPGSSVHSRWEHWNGLPFPSPVDLSDPGIEPGSPALQADYLPSEPPGKSPRAEFRANVLWRHARTWTCWEEYYPCSSWMYCHSMVEELSSGKVRFVTLHNSTKAMKWEWDLSSLADRSVRKQWYRVASGIQFLRRWARNRVVGMRTLRHCCTLPRFFLPLLNIEV